MAIIGSRSTWRNETPASRRTRGPLIKVKHPSGAITKMYEQDAIDAGLVQRKQAPQPGNKQAPAPNNKPAATPSTKQDESPAQEPAATEEQAEQALPVIADDFTTINGVGRATARLLNAQGVVSFDQLRKADLSTLSLSKTAVASIEAWRNG